MPKILILNGPPNTGTYELAQQLGTAYDAIPMSAYAATLARKPRMIVYDVGYAEELQMLIDSFTTDIFMVHVVRDGCSYDRDPRNYVDHPCIDAVTIVVDAHTSLTLGFLGYLFFELDRTENERARVHSCTDL